MATTRVMRTLSIHKQTARDGLVVERAPGEESSQSWYAGAPLVYDASTKEIEEWAGGTDATLPVGVAVSKASGTAGTAVSYYEANPVNLFEGSLINGTDAYVLLGTELGKSYSLVKSSNDWYVDIADTTTTRVEVVGLIDDVGDTNARVIVRFLQAAWEKVI